MQASVVTDALRVAWFRRFNQTGAVSIAAMSSRMRSTTTR